MKTIFNSIIFSLLLFIVVPDQIYGQSQYYITGADDTEIFVEEFGTGKPVVLLSGGPLITPSYVSGIWENMSSQFRWIVLHQRGTGNSLIEDADSTTFSLENYTKDIEALKKHLEAEQLTLVGHSWGGMLAMEYTSKYPEQVKRLVLLDSGGPTLNMMSYYEDNIQFRLHEEDRAEMKGLMEQNKHPLPGFWPGYFFDRKKALESKAETDFDNYFGQIEFNSLVLNYYRAGEKQRVKGLKNYAGPVFLIQGRQDPVGESTAFEIRDVLPQTELHFIEKAGHMPWLENEPQVKEFYELLTKALE